MDYGHISRHNSNSKDVVETHNRREGNRRPGSCQESWTCRLLFGTEIAKRLYYNVLIPIILMQMAAIDGIHKSSENAMCNRTNTHLLRIYNNVLLLSRGRGVRKLLTVK